MFLYKNIYILFFASLYLQQFNDCQKILLCKFRLTTKNARQVPKSDRIPRWPLRSTFKSVSRNHRQISAKSETIPKLSILAWYSAPIEESSLRCVTAKQTFACIAQPCQLSCASRAVVWVTFVFAARKLGRRHLTFLFVLRDWKRRTIYSERTRICTTTISDAAARSAKLCIYRPSILHTST